MRMRTLQAGRELRTAGQARASNHARVIRGSERVSRRVSSVLQVRPVGTGGASNLFRGRHADLLELQRTAGNKSVASLLRHAPTLNAPYSIQRQNTSQAKEEKKAEAKDEVQQAVEGAVEEAKKEIPSAVGDKVKDVVEEKVKDPAVKQAQKSGDPLKEANAEAAGDALADAAGKAAETIVEKVLDGSKVGDPLDKALQKKLAPKFPPPFTLPSLDLQGCSVKIGKPSPLFPSATKVLSEPEKFGVKWTPLTAKCTFGGGEALSLSATGSARGFLDNDFSPQVPNKFDLGLKFTYKSSNITFSADYKVTKDPEQTGQFFGVNAKVFF